MSCRKIQLELAQFLRERTSEDSRIALAVSGGIDSMVLLHACVATRKLVPHRELCVVTVDHGTRPGSLGDSLFVQKIATRFDFPVFLKRFDLGERASEHSCREARYSFFDGLDVDYVALAHNRDDQAETLLINLLRGTHVGGMPEVRSDRYIRPLLNVSREEINKWALRWGVRWREDPTNRSPRYLRNRVRHELLPLFEELRPGATKCIARLAGEYSDG